MKNRRWYIGGFDSNLADMECVMGPYSSAARAASHLHDVLAKSNGPPVSLFSGRDLPAALGDFFGVEPDHCFGVLLGPYKTAAEARRGIEEEVEAGDATFNSIHATRLAVVRYLRQEHKDAPQVLILEAVERPRTNKVTSWLPA